MAEGKEHKSFGGRKPGGSSHSGSRGGKGFKPRGKGGQQRGGFHKNERRADNSRYRDDRHNAHSASNGERRQFTDDEKREYREHKRTEYMDKPRRNSDGTMSFPSQNPYTNRRPDEPKMPKGLEWSMLSKDEKERLRGLAKEHAENVGLHILAAYTLIDDSPEAALEHAKWVAKQASRIDFARETLAFVAYRMGDYKLALREFRTAYRMNGYADYLPFIADCERGVGNPNKAIEVALGDDAKRLGGEAKAEMFLVYAGALADLEQWSKAIKVAHTLGHSKGLAGGYRMRALQAEQLFLEEAGRGDEADKLQRTIEKLEDQYADFDEDMDDAVIDHDLAELADDEELLEQLGIDPDAAQYAPEEGDDAAGPGSDEPLQDAE
ncbi:helicase [Bifidobacterium sp. DSM 109963]|uniref:Helicase n=1 Tax=Bifidobacterium panos TaxID=2675321 RepID=A0ABX1SYM5_9BIFI|nr:helicase [Bifidobacterium sp. DSM 109963]